MKEPVRIFSDLHLGHKASRIDRVESLRPLIRGAGTVVFNGDTWQELAEPWRERSAKMLEELKAICAEEGAEAIFLSGNHDPGWEGRGWLELAEGRIVITHGDALLYASSPWKREILSSPELVDRLWDQHPEAATKVEERLRLARRIARELRSVEFTHGRSLLQRVWDAAWPPSRAWQMLHAWWNQARIASEFCERYFPNAEVLIIGHFHWSGSWQRDGRQIINTGSFVNPSSAQWVEWGDGELRRGCVNESEHGCELGAPLDTWRF